MAAGCIAGGVEATAVWPMEFIKTQLQLGGAGGKQLPYTGMISGLRYTVESTGFLSLYRGLAPTLLGSIPKAGIRFGLNAIIKDNLRDKDGKLTIGKNFIAGKIFIEIIRLLSESRKDLPETFSLILTLIFDCRFGCRSE